MAGESIKPLVYAELKGLPPSVNAIWRSAHATGRVFKTTEAKNWQKETTAIFKANKTNAEPTEGKVKVKINLLTKTKRRMDIDNRVKSTLDCLAPAGIIKDDSQVWELKVLRFQAEEDRTQIWVTLIEDE